jgi:TolB-like protein/DNA-binding winged helix-turn-helix (wHTH) protein/cytochrome c-type biogenesis protein CcmH/NrfG
MQDSPPLRYTFDQYCLDVRDRRLTSDGNVISLEPKSFDVLRYLLDNAGRLVHKQELVEAVWARPVVSDNSLTRCIHQVRAALQDSADQPRFIETVPGSGYRFIAVVDVAEGSTAGTGMVSGEQHTWHRPAILTAAGATAVAIALISAWLIYNPDVPRIERLAVLPLANLTGSAEQDHFVQGVHDGLIAELSRIGSIEVISRTSVLGFRDTETPVPEIADRLDVDAVIEGSVLRAGDNLTVTAQLIATNPERHLWAGRYHRDSDAVFEITTDIVSAIAAEIAVELSPAQQSIHRPTTNGDAYEAYLLGRFQFEQRTPDAYRKAQQQFRRAIELDPSFAAPYAGLAHTYGSAAIFGVLKPGDAFPEAERLAAKAVQLDSTLADAHMILAGVQFYWHWNPAEAERTAEHALSLNPNLANAYRFLSEVYSVTGRHEEALAAVERGRALDPLPPTSQFKPSLILYLGRDFDASIARSRAALEHYPQFWQGHWLLCIALAATEQHDEAVESCAKAAQVSNDLPMALGGLGYALALAGRHDEAAGIAARLEARSETVYIGPASIAMIYGALGKMDEAFVHLASAYEYRDQQLIHAEQAAFFDPLRTDRRFPALRNSATATVAAIMKR